MLTVRLAGVLAAQSALHFRVPAWVDLLVVAIVRVPDCEIRLRLL